MCLKSHKLLQLMMMTLAPRRTQIWVFDGQNRILDKIVGRRKKRRSYEYEVSGVGLRAALAWLTCIGMVEGQEGTCGWAHERPRAGTCTIWVPGQKVFAAALRFKPDADPWIVRQILSLKWYQHLLRFTIARDTAYYQCRRGVLQLRTVLSTYWPILLTRTLTMPAPSDRVGGPVLHLLQQVDHARGADREGL